MEKSFEDILREKMEQPVNIKGSEETVMPMEAMVMSVMNDAMRGNLSSIMFIKSLMEKKTGNSEEYMMRQYQLLIDTQAELRQELEDMDVGKSAELELLAMQLMTLRRIADVTLSEGHKDIVVTPQKNGSEKTELSTTNKIFNDLYKQWVNDWRDFKQSLVSREMKKKMLKR